MPRNTSTPRLFRLGYLALPCVLLLGAQADTAPAAAVPFHAATYSYGTSGGFVLPDAHPTVYQDDTYPALSSLGDLNDGKLVSTSASYTIPDPSVGWEDTSQAQITFDLGGRFQLDSVEIGYAGIPSFSKWAPDDVNVSFSNDGVNFSAPVYADGFIAFTHPAGNNYQRADLAVPAPPGTIASHVRLEFDGGTNNTATANGYLLDDVRFSGTPRQGVAPYANNDPDTFLLYHLNEATGLHSGGGGDFFIADASGRNQHLRTNYDTNNPGSNTSDPTRSPFDGVAGPPGLGGAATSNTSSGYNQRMYRIGSADMNGINTETFTLEAWVRNPVPDAYAGIFRVGDGANGLIQFGTNINGDRLRLAGFFDNAQGSRQFREYVSTETVTFEPDVWYHVAVTYDNQGGATPDDSLINFYFDSIDDIGGQPTRPGTQLGDTLTVVFDVWPFASTTSGEVRVGEWNNDQHFNGDLAEVRWSNVVRSEFNLAVPEPAAWLLLLSALGCGLLARRRRGR